MIHQPNDKLPIFNLSTDDLPGEIWRGIPDLEEYGQVSNYGRVKRLGRTRITKQGFQRFYKDRIFSSSLVERQSTNDGQYHFGLLCSLSIDGVLHSFNPVRFVYHLFTRPFDYHNSRLVVTAINGNDLDIRPDNLHITQSYIYQKKRQKIPLDRKIQYFKNRRYDKAVIYRKKYISCYDTSGNRKETFKSLELASERTGLPLEHIEAVIQNPFDTLGGFYWRIGRKITTDLKLILKEKELLNKERNGLKITQFDLNGNPINFYLCVTDAAQAIGITQFEIIHALDHPGQIAGFFLWRRGHLYQPISGI